MAWHNNNHTGREKIKGNEILVDRLYVNDESFDRYYHHNTIPTRYFVSRSGKIYSEMSEKILSPGTNPAGYYVMGFSIQGYKKSKYIQIHKMVATVYLGWHKDLVIDHIDGNKKNNDVNNLEWVTSAENARRAYAINLHKKRYGNNNWSTKYSDQTIHSVCKYLSEGLKAKEISNRCGVPIEYVWKLAGKSVRPDICNQYTYPPGVYTPNNVIPDEIKTKIIQRYNEHVPLRSIQSEFNMYSYSQILHAIYNKKSNNIE